jgi:hypothetical protein
MAFAILITEVGAAAIDIEGLFGHSVRVESWHYVHLP